LQHSQGSWCSIATRTWLTKRDSVEALQQRQQTIKDKIAAMRQANPKLTFAAAWTKLQQQKPDLFEGLD
jgi:hypothetical protein